MSGVMPTPQRNKAIDRLRTCAEKLLKARRDHVPGQLAKLDQWGLDPQQSWSKKLEAAWRAFPECERDERVPSPEEVIEICDRLDRELEEATRNGWV